MEIIRLENVSYFYPDSKVPALEDISLEISEGEFVCVVGHNGSGKSTFSKLLNGLILPSQGKVTVYGMDTSDEDKSLEIKKHVGLCFQNPDNQIVNTVVEDDVAFGPENLGVSPEKIRKAVDEALIAVGMEDYKTSAPHMLSGGQKQRIAIAGLLAMSPGVLVLDESTAMLDPIGRKDVIDIVTRLNKENGITVIMITQYMEEATAASRLIVLSEGSVVMDDTPTRIFAQSNKLMSYGLCPTPTVELRNRLFTIGMPPTNAITPESLAIQIAGFLRGGIQTWQ